MDDNISEFLDLRARPSSPDERPIAIKLIGVGGAGSNAADRLSMAGLNQVHLAVVNTDSQALNNSPVGEKLLIGRGVTRGLGAGGDPELGRLAAEADREAIEASVRNHDLVILVAGMGGGTGSGAAPVVAEAASKAGALVIAFVTLPFTFEGGRRMKQAEDGLIALRGVADAVIPLPNDMLLQQVEEDASVLDAFARGDEWIDRAVRSIWNIHNRAGLINLDFATLREVFAYRSGKTLYGLGTGEGPQAAMEAIEDFRNCPLLHTPEFSRKADRLLVNITGGTDLTLIHVQQIMSAITEEFGRNAHVALGAVIDESWNSRVEICVIGTTDISSRGPRRAVSDRTAAIRQAARAAVERARLERGKDKSDAGAAEAEPAKVSTKASVDPGRKVSAERKAQPLPQAHQDEFSFAEAEPRGHFDQSERTLFEGEDLDVPTFRRRGIKLAF